MFSRRLGKTGNRCEYGDSCPQVLLMDDGNFTAVGTDIREEAVKALPPGPGIGPNEGAVIVPREVMLDALADIIASLKSA